MTDPVAITLGVTAALVPTITVLVGILINRNDANRLDTRITTEFTRLETGLGARIDKVENRLVVIEGDLRQFYKTLGEHGEAIDTLKKRAGL